MLTIRDEQIEVLGRQSAAGMEDRAVRHLRGCIPDVCAGLPEDRLRAIIRWGRTRSASHGIDREFDFFRYLNLMFMFGFEFDVDSRYPWAARALATRKTSRAKMDLLMDHAMLYCSQNSPASSQPE